MAIIEAGAISKLHPKLRMLANGSTEVNALRAEHAAALRVSGAVAGRYAISRAQGDVPRTAAQAGAEATTVTALEHAPDAEVSVFLALTADAGDDDADVAGVTASRANLLTAQVPVATATRLRERGDVASVELGQPLTTPAPTVADDAPEPPPEALRRFGAAEQHGFAEGVLIGLIDVGGFDFAHPDFLTPEGGTRFVRIWDQGGDGRPSPAARGTTGFDYGAELRRQDMDHAIASAAEAGLPAVLLEPQSQMEDAAHATHVASIAAGNRGISRQAWIAGVLISIPEADQDRRRSFYDSTRLAHAVDYLLAVADELAAERGGEPVPVSINVSLGTNGHGHDDSAAVSRWIDLALARPGRSVCVAAGNAGQERAEQAGDIGWVTGRIHTSGRVGARELGVDIEWNVAGNGVADLSENELEIWYGAQDRFAVQIKPPGQPWTDPIEPGQYIENRQLPDKTFLSIYNELYHPVNGANYIALYLSPLLREGEVVGVSAGEWVIHLIGREVRDGAYHAWIERDDPGRIGQVGARETWRFPSFFSERSTVDESTISSLACGQRIVAVANLDEARRRIAITSSQGPTRDGREKPDVAAPGTGIVAAKGFAGAGEWVAMSGTSMASPHVTGVIGLMLGANPGLTGAQINGILKRTARPLPGADFTWVNDAGSGVVDPQACIAEATAMLTRTDLT